ncbi:MAG: outer membrane protein assembly factor BamB family protein, partial [Planctomycetota bacterium]
ERFPVRLPFAVSSGITAGGSYAMMGSLGSPGDNRTVESVNLADGRVGWGWRTRGLVWATPQVDPTGNSLVVAGEDGTVTSLPVGEGAPSGVNWSTRLTGAVTASPAITPEHVVVGSHDGLVRCLDLATGNVNWLEGVDAPIRTGPWIVGGMEKVLRPSGVEGAPDIEVQTYQGIAFARNRNGLYAFDLASGARLFEDPEARRPVCRTGRWVVTIDRSRTLSFRDAEDGYEVKGRLPLGMFDLIPTNGSDGAIFGCTHDGGIVAAVPGP